MPNHVHLVLVPRDGDGLRAALAPLYRRYTWEINQREGWRGHLWQSRFASFPMDEAHVQACLRYVELNPVRAGLVVRPEGWRWSSARAHLGLAGDGLTEEGPARARVDNWRAFLSAGLDEAALAAIRLGERTGRLESPFLISQKKGRRRSASSLDAPAARPLSSGRCLRPCWPSRRCRDCPFR